MRQPLLPPRLLAQSLRSNGHSASSCSARAFATASRCSLTSTRPHQRSYVHHARLRPLVRRNMPELKRNDCGCACASGGGCGSSGPQKKTAYIALGSNMGDRVAEIERACNEMDRRGIKVKRTSSLWETEPMYVTDQDRFVNGACEVETELDPIALLDQLQAIENDMGRKKVIDKGPRNIDLDILLYGDEKVDHERLKIPHIGILEREFVLRPLAELVPAKSLDPTKPWKLIQDNLNELPLGEPLSSMTPLSSTAGSLTPLAAKRKTHVMGILNLTPDSFSDGGFHDRDNLAQTIMKMVKNGTSIIDVGGQSTAPGRPEVSAEEEASRVVPAVQLIRSLPEARDVAISIDTYRASVAEEAIASGADIINDVSAGLLDPDMLSTVGRLEKTICLMHMRGTPQTMTKLTSYPDGLIPTIASELLERVAAAEAAGIRRWRMILDPGIGFAKTGEQNLEILRRLEELRYWPGLQGLPWLVGSSRKTFVGKITGVTEPKQRTWGTAATVAAAVQGGADIVRVHDTQEMGMVAKMADAIWRA
ncbi:probable multifunctional folic acid synthesis protein [Fusarium mangiferae]|uniref:Folic acid synthesis protein FOL1 n=1 Tax=Fusarium mangiferae TaxID=192010 RepID=A0A1L7TST9_FUSMA|nr:putative multifunctional folic acid synthesis protein [Fusarium mangiferae]CVK99892.1 probable multifunctional folic acid synthesis protein [Fusarium mangiferae]